MTTARKKTTKKAQMKKVEETPQGPVVELSDVQINQVGLIMRDKQAVMAQLKDLQVRESQLWEIILDSKGYVGEELKSMTAAKPLGTKEEPSNKFELIGVPAKAKSA